MNWPAYSSYQSHADIGDYPVGWKPSKLRYLLQTNPPVPAFVRTAQHEEVTFLPMEAIGQDGSLDISRNRPSSELLVGYSYFANGDVLMAKVTPCFENGKSALVECIPSDHGFGTSEVTTLRPSIELDQRFLGYLVRTDRFRQSSVAAMTGAGGLKRVPDEHVREFRIGLPPKEDQRIIASFLDLETGKIDALISKQDQLIETLREDRATTITQAVTKGLDPDIEMKESGVEWLGKIPVHWIVSKLSWHSSCRSGESTLSTEVNQDISEESSVKVIGGNGTMGYTQTGFVTQELLAIGRVGALCGNVHRISPPAWITDNALMLHVRSGFELEYLAHTLRSRRLNDIASQTAQPLITGKQVLDQRLPLPPPSEQRAISAYISDRCTKIDALIDKSTNMIENLREYRSALITDAVTGKIDVRDAA